MDVYGDQSKHPMITFHDIGMNGPFSPIDVYPILGEEEFQSFFQFSDVPEFSQEFCIYNINAIGQEKGADTLPNR